MSNVGVWAKPGSEDRLRALLADPRNLTAGAIARELNIGVTRNGVIGKIRRLGLTLPGAVPTSQKAKRKPKPKPPAAGKRTPPKPPIIDGTVVQRERRLTIMDLTAAHCRYIHGDPKAGADAYFYCGKQVVGGQSWCLRHDMLCRPGVYR